MYAQSAAAAIASRRHRSGLIAHTSATAATNHNTVWTSALEEFDRARRTPSAAVGRLEVPGVLCTSHHCVTDDDNDTTVTAASTTTNGAQRCMNSRIAGAGITARYPSLSVA